MPKYFSNVNLFLFPPVGKECHAVNAGRPKRWNTKQWRQQVPLHKTHTNKQKKQNKTKEAKKVQENFIFIC